MSTFPLLARITVRKATLVALASILIILLVPSNGFAECPPPLPSCPLGPGEIGLFFDPAGTTTCTEVPYIGAMITLYMVLRVPEGGVASYAIPELLTSSGSVQVLGSTAPGDTLYEVHIVLDGCSMAVRKDPQNCPVIEGDLLVLAAYQVMLFTMTGTVCFQTACPTIAGTVPMNPAYTRCDTEEWGEFTGGESMCLGLGEAPIPTAERSWGKIKELYKTPMRP